MKKNPDIRQAIDENLSSVHFDMQDMHSVLRDVRRQQAPHRARRRRAPLHLILATSMAMLIMVPLSIIAIRAQNARTAITTITALGTQTADKADAGSEDPIAASPAPWTDNDMLSKSDIIAAARACFEAHCDTEIFQFDEYTVDVQREFAYGSDPSESHCVVTMESIYDNGCSFRVIISPTSGEVISYSTPRLATMPARLDSTSAEIQAWYDKYGAHIFTWPLDIQAEFSRRYEGGMLRTPREGEITRETILKRAPLFADTLSSPDGSSSVSVYCMLYSERAFADGMARYKIYCFPSGHIDDGLPQTCLLVTMLAQDGTIESSEHLSTDGL